MIQASTLSAKLNIQKDMHIADFGCGASQTLFTINHEYKNKNLKLFFLDINREILKKITKEIEHTHDVKNNNTFKTIWSNIEQENGSTLEDKSVDIIILENTYNYLAHKKSCLLEMKRVLKVGGKILFIDQHTSYLKSTFVQQLLTDKKHVERSFEQAGFLVYPIVDTDDPHSYAFIAENATKIIIHKQ